MKGIESESGREGAGRAGANAGLGRPCGGK
jgi:hypothetical protein